MLFISALTLLGCGAREREGVTARAEAKRADDDTVIATVDGQAIRAAQVELQARAAGVSPKEALEELINAEVVAAEATRRGLAADPSVREGIQGEMVRRFLAETFEKSVTSAAVTDEDLRHAWSKNAGVYDHPELVQVRHILAASTGADDAARRTALRARMAEVAAAARGVASPEAFSALATRFSDATIKLVVQDGITDRTTMTVPPFAQAAFALVNKGDTSGVVETSFGFHVIYLLDRIPERHSTFPQAVPDMRAKMWPAVRKREFGRWVDQLTDKHKILLAPQLLDEPAQ